MKRSLTMGAVLLALLIVPVVVAILLLAGPQPGLRYEEINFADLPGWHTADIMAAKPALLKSCEKMANLPSNRRLPGAAIGGVGHDWTEGCNALVGAGSRNALQQALLDHFEPLAVSLDGESEGLFTGYYEALLQGSRERSARYNVPLYMRPPELVMVDLGAFRSDLRGRRIAGSVRNGRLMPYPDRAAINDGALDDRDLEVLWVDSAVDAYFLHVQGSGRVQMPDGSLLGIGYAAQNGHANRLIGRYLIETGAIERANISGQSIRAWLEANPDQIEHVLNTDPSFVFFRELNGGDGPFGSANVSLTPGHSLAVDRKHLPLHAPIWLSASYPNPTASDSPDLPLNRLMVAQDTGGAIQGEIRGDVFWGFGDDAEEIAGRMANRGRYWLILPKMLAAKALRQNR
ncbi:murein transglycosylase A [Kordiimonas aquimaris]|uniref:murein transglycosylase A n=1 Tax=Kordiimonas aquimaris TaxID=707591 RepID=UPI0021CE2952|nr:MltA domain-containing protein [Kordiimonas aquimaris]